MMKKTNLALLLVGALTSSVALASDNTITFQGEVADETCTVTVNGNTYSPVVLLPTVSTNDLSMAGQTAGDTTFEIGVTGCTGTTTGDVRISTVFVGNLVTNDGNLGSTGTANNVDIQILDIANNVIDFNSTFNGEGDLTLTSNQTEASATYIAQYYATDASTAGTVQASMQYAISYQ